MANNPAYCVVVMNKVDESAAGKEMMDRYRKNVGPTMQAFGGSVVAMRDPNNKQLRQEVKEGSMDHILRLVLLRFPSYEKAKGWYESAEYQKIIGDRLKATGGSFVIMSGLPDKGMADPEPGKNPAYIISLGGPQDQSTDAAKESLQKYQKAVGGTFKAFSASPVCVTGGQMEVKEGTPENERFILLRFPSYEKAKGWYESPEYQQIVGLRTAIQKSNMAVVEGLPDPGLAKL